MMAASPHRLRLFFTLAAGGLLADLATKHWAFARLGMPGQQPPWWLWPEYVGLETSLNEGALFGMGQGMVPVFATLSIAALGGIAYWLFVAGGSHDLLLTCSLGMVTGGILGNLYDRLGLHGLRWPPHLRPDAVGERVFAVRDFVLLQLNQEWRWPNFNVADSLLVCGAALLVWHAFHAPATEATAPGQAPPGNG